ncbi:MAG: hypothetical protein V3R83_09875 [Gammaproteobacteria bacterium]
MSTAECCLTGNGGRKIPLEFTNLGCMRMEIASGIKLSAILSTMGELVDASVGPTAAKRAAATAAAQTKVGMTEILCLLYAGLEGHRAKAGRRPNEYTLDDASDIMDECGGMAAISAPVGRAFALYMPKLTGTSATEPVKKKAPKAERTAAAKASQSS